MGKEMSFDFTTAGRIIFGLGTIDQVDRLALECGTKPLILTGSGKANPQKVFTTIESIPLRSTHFRISGEPTVEDIQAAVNLARNESCDFVIGFGGGSVMDSGKAVAAMMKNPGSVMDYLEGIGGNQPIKNPSAPYIAIPTTSGTGSEVTKNSVVTVKEKQVKVSMRSPYMIPRIALIDPQLTVSLPPDVTAFTGMDALTQVIEPYVTIKRNGMTDITSLEGIKRAARSLRKAFSNGADIEAREDMSFASLMGGISLANAGLGMVHGFAGVIGGMFNAHHGAICACLLPPVVEINITALLNRSKDNDALKRYLDIARSLTGKNSPEYRDIWEYLQQLRTDLKIPPLREMKIQKSNFDEIIGFAIKASSTKGNPIQLTSEEMKKILDMAY
jgi:alcohol dehydrogenase class IV